MGRNKKTVLYKYKNKRGEEKVAFIPVKKVRQIEDFINRQKERKKEGENPPYPSFEVEQPITKSDLEDIFKYLDEQEAKRLRIEEKIKLILELIKEIKKRKKRSRKRR